MRHALVRPGHPRSAVVTGAGRGIGRAIAVELVGRGFQVVVTDVDEDAARLTAAQIGAADACALDVTDADANRTVARRAASLAPLGAWVCNAGVLEEGALTALTDRQVRLQVEVNLLGVLWGIRAAADVMREERVAGDIGIVASLSSHAPVPGLATYAATKAGVLSIATSTASELRRDRIRVHAVCPDGVDTAMVAEMDPTGGVRSALAAGVMLTPQVVARELVDLFGRRRVYRTLPAWRGVLGRLGSLLPTVFAPVDRVMRWWGAWRLRRSR